MNNIVSLFDVCKAASSNIAQKDLAENDGEYPIYGASGLIKNIDFYKQDKPYLAIVKDGAGVGRVSRMPAYSSVIGTMQYILPNEKVDINYLYYILAKLDLARYHNGATIPHIYFKDYGKEKITLPPLSKQRRIAAILDKVTTLIVERKLQLEKIDLLVKSRFIEMFGDPVANPMKWEAKRLDEIAKTRLGKMLDVKKQKGDCSYPYLANFNVQWFQIDLRKLNEMDFSEDERIEFELRDGDLLICEGGEVGRTAIWRNEKKNVFFQKAIHRVRCNEDVCIPEYLAWVMYFKGNTTYFDGLITSATIAHLTGEKLKKLMIQVPSINIQSRFADFIRQIDKIKSELQEGVSDLEMLYGALMHIYFGGKDDERI